MKPVDRAILMLRDHKPLDEVHSRTLLPWDTLRQLQEEVRRQENDHHWDAWAKASGWEDPKTKTAERKRNAPKGSA